MYFLMKCFSLLICHPFFVSATCSSGHPAFVRRPFVFLNSDSFPSEFVIEVHESPPSACFGLCVVDKNCSAYFVNYRNQSCLIVKEEYDFTKIEDKLVKDTVGSYHRKICLPGTLLLHWGRLEFLITNIHSFVIRNSTISICW